MKTMQNRAEFAATMIEREILFAQMAEPNDVKPTWTKLKRKGSRIRTKVLRQIIAHVEGKFYMSQKRISFENESDALVFQLMFPATTRHAR